MADSTTRLALPYPELDDQADISEAVQPLAEALDNSVLITTGTSLPTQPVTAGTMFLNTSTGVVYMSSGSAWLSISTNGGAAPIGSMIDYGGATDPVDQDGSGRWVIADGRAISRSIYAACFTALSTTYGVGNTLTTFNIPDARGSVTVGVDGSAARLTANDALGNRGGAETVILTAANMPARVPINSTTTVANVPVTITTGWMAPATSGAWTSGSGTAHSNMQPYLVVNKLIRIA